MSKPAVHKRSISYYSGLFLSKCSLILWPSIKTSTNWRDITCKNCLRTKPKGKR